MKKGISLIVLVITIIVIIILAGSVILSLSNNNPIAQATEASYKTSMDAYNSELSMTLSSMYVQNSSFNPNNFYVGSWDGTGTGNGTIKQYIPSMTKEDGLDYVIAQGRIEYIGSDTTKKEWAKSLGVTDGLILWLDGRDFKNSPQTTTWVDRSGNNNNGSVRNFAYTTSSGSDGGHGVFFDGIDDNIYLQNINFTTLTNATISFWRKSNVVKNWLLLGDITPNYWLMAIRPADSVYKYFYHNNVGSSTVVYVDGVASTTPIDDNQWHYYLVTNANLSNWKTATLSNYVNYQYHSYLGNLKIYNRGFTASDVIKNYNEEKVEFGL